MRSGPVRKAHGVDPRLLSLAHLAALCLYVFILPPTHLPPCCSGEHDAPFALREKTPRRCSPRIEPTNLWSLFPHPRPLSRRARGGICSPPERGGSWVGLGMREKPPSGYFAGITGNSTADFRFGPKCSVTLPPKTAGGRSSGSSCSNGPQPRIGFFMFDSVAASPEYT